MKCRWTKAIRICAVFILGMMIAGISACSLQENEEEKAVIQLSDQGSTISGSARYTAGVKVSGSRIEITAAGNYEFSGTLNGGQIYVLTPAEDTVTLRLNGVNLTNETEPVIYSEEVNMLCIELAEGSENLLQSGTVFQEKPDEDAKGGALFCRDDMTIGGTGTLTVNGYINDGIHCNDSLTVESGTIEVNAAHHAVKTNTALSVKGGSLSLTAGTDGINSEGSVLLKGGGITIDAGDDGIHADQILTVEDGTIGIVESYEGMEAHQIHIENGDISITSQDDGINANGGQDLFGFFMRSEKKEENEKTEEEEDPEIIIDGGTIYVNAGGDGLDSNKDLIINGGLILVDGPESSRNGALDYGRENGGTCQINGGTILAIGASGMAETFGDSSSQASFRLTFGTENAGTEILIEDSGGNELFTYTSAKSFSSLVFSSPDIEVGKDYVVTIGNESYSFRQDSISSSGTLRGNSGNGSDRQPGGPKKR